MMNILYNRHLVSVSECEVIENRHIAECDVCQPVITHIGGVKQLWPDAKEAP
jgi:hypothetical protein